MACSSSVVLSTLLLKRRRQRLLFGLALVLTLSCVAQQVPSRAPGAAKYRISGKVVNALTGEVLPGAVVSLGPAQGEDTIDSVRTGETGEFRFEGLHAGKYALRAEARGFSRQGFDEHDGFFTGIVAGGVVDSEHLVFRLRPDAVIAGQIVDENNEPVREGQVMLYRRQRVEGRESTTMFSSAALNDEGQYRFPHLSAGTYFVVVRAHPWYAQNGEIVQVGKMRQVENGVVVDGAADSDVVGEQGTPAELQREREFDVAYPTTYYPGVTEESGATPIVLEAGQRITTDMRLIAVPAVHLRVHAAGADESDTLRADLAQRIFDGPPQPAQGSQSEKGEVDVAGLPPGEYEVQVQSYGKIPQSWTQEVAVTADAEITVARQTSGAQVKGTIRLEDGSFPTSGFVQLTSAGRSFGAQILDKGEFEFGEPVPPGRYEVNAGGPPGGRPSAIAAQAAKVEGQMLEIGTAGVVHLSIKMSEKLGTVNGTVLRAGKPLPGAMVVLVPQDFRNNLGLIRRDQSDLDGTFTLPAVLPGKYTVVAIPDAWDSDWVNTLSAHTKGSATVDVAGSRKYEVKVAAE